MVVLGSPNTQLLDVGPFTKKAAAPACNLNHQKRRMKIYSLENGLSEYKLKYIFAPFLSLLITVRMLQQCVVNCIIHREEWAWLQSHVYSTTNGSAQNPLGGEDESLMESGGLVEFIRSLRAAVTHLLTKLNIPLYRVTLVPNSRLQPLLSELVFSE